MHKRLLPIALIALLGAPAVVRGQGEEPVPAQEADTAKVTLDYEFFKARVQPILAATRPGHATCYTCHYVGQHVLRDGAPPLVEKLEAGQTTWTEEQARKNFQKVSSKVVPGNLKASRLLIHPLLYEAGGDISHAGGKHWTSTSDPEWGTLAAWVMGEKLSPKR